LNQLLRSRLSKCVSIPFFLVTVFTPIFSSVRNCAYFLITDFTHGYILCIYLITLWAIIFHIVIWLCQFSFFTSMSIWDSLWVPAIVSLRIKSVFPVRVILWKMFSVKSITIIPSLHPWFSIGGVIGFFNYSRPNFLFLKVHSSKWFEESNSWPHSRQTWLSFFGFC